MLSLSGALIANELASTSYLVSIVANEWIALFWYVVEWVA